METDAKGNPVYWPSPPGTNKVAAKEFKMVNGQKVYKAIEGTIPSAGGTGLGGTNDDAEQIAGAIASGMQPPDMKGLYRFGGPVRAKLAKMGYDYTTANKDWQAVQKHLLTLNGPQQERLRQAITFTYDSLDIIENLYNDLEKTGLPGGFKILNKAALAAARNVPGEAGKLAQALEAQINDLTSELGTVYKGGNSSTDESLRLAAKNLEAEWSPKTFHFALEQIRKNLTIRRNSILTSKPAGLSTSPETSAPPGGAVAPTGVPSDADISKMSAEELKKYLGE
jgi:hypothetical protein